MAKEYKIQHNWGHITYNFPHQHSDYTILHRVCPGLIGNWFEGIGLRVMTSLKKTDTKRIKFQHKEAMV